MTLPITYAVEVAWTGDLTGVFRVGISTVGGTDLIAGAFNGNTFDDITAYVFGFSTTRGRPDDLGEIEQGTATITLRDRTGRFNPENASSDLYAYLVPLRPVRIRATHNGITYGIFQGYIDRIEYNPDDRTAVIECVDFFEHLTQDMDESHHFDATLAGDIIGEVLDILELTDPSLRSLDAGRALIPSLVSNGSPGVVYLNFCGDVSDADRGLFFITKAGVVRYISGESYWARTAVSATLDGDVTSDMRVAVDKQRIVNQVTVSRVLDDFSATNEASRRRYGFRRGDTINPGFDIATAAEAQSLAQWVVAIQGDPSVPARAITLKPKNDAVVVSMLGLEVGDRVAFSEPRGNTNAEGKIEGVNHTVEIGTLHQAQFLVSKRTHDAFTVGLSTIDGADLIYW